MKIDEHIKNLEEYCEDDDLFEKDGDFKEFCDNHIADIKAVIQELKTTQSDLYEANNRINDLLRIIDEKEEAIIEIKSICINNKPHIAQQKIIKYIEERCKNAKD